MSIKVTLSQDQINKIISSDPEIYFQAFRDDNGTETIDERSTFPEKLKFYMNKINKSVGDLVDFLSTEYPLIKSKASVHHYLSGVRTPKLSVVFAIAECLEIAPANLLPGVPGKYIDYVTNHVEMLDTPTYFENIPEELTDLEEADTSDEASLTASDLEDPEVDEWSDFMFDEEDEDGIVASTESNEGESSSTEEIMPTEANDFVKQPSDDKVEQKELDEIDDLMAAILGD